MTVPAPDQRSTTDEAGFSLLEMLVVLGLLALVAVVSWPLLRGPSNEVRLKAAADEIVASARLARAEALRTGREVALGFDVDQRRYGAPGIVAPRSLPSSAALEVILPSAERTSPGTGRVRFFADGTTTGGRIVMRIGARSTVVVIDWLTGAAHAVAGL